MRGSRNCDRITGPRRPARCQDNEVDPLVLGRDGYVDALLELALFPVSHIATGNRRGSRFSMCAYICSIEYRDGME